MKNPKNQIILFGFFFHVLAALFSIGYHHCDELFQVFEFAGYKLGINTAGDLPWEFHERMRSGIQPWLVYTATRACHGLSIDNPFLIATCLRLFQSLFSFLVLVKLYKQFETQLSTEKLQRWLWWSLLFWCLPYFHARFSSENFSATLFILGLTMVLATPRPMVYGRLFAAGLLFGLAFVSRFQAGFMVFGLLIWIWCFQQNAVKRLIAIKVGLLCALGIGLLADRWLYGQYTLSWWNYLDMNLFQNKASQFGTEPFYYYLTETFLQLIPPFSVAIITGIVVFWYKFKKHPLTWITLPFILAHFFVGHKELRFLFPVLNFIPFMCLMAMHDANNKTVLWLQRKGPGRFFVTVNAVALLIFTFKPADNISFSLKKIYDLTEGPAPTLLYEGNNPYNNMAALNYFRKKNLTTAPIDSLTALPQNSYLFVENMGPPQRVHGSMVYTKIYCNYPAWITRFNFNGWLDRTFCFTIYRYPPL